MYHTPDAYLRLLMTSRAGRSPTRTGSYYPDKTPIQVFEAVERATWTPYNAPGLPESYTAYRASIPGRLDVVRIENLRRGSILLMDQDERGGMCATYPNPHPGEAVSFSIAVIGPMQGEYENILWGLHPGDPFKPCQIRNGGQILSLPNLLGSEMTREEALSMGLVYAKLAEIESV